MSDDTASTGELFDAQMQSQGVGALKVTDGEMFMFSTAVLEALLARAKASKDQRVVVFVKTQVGS